jgi:hypothetical protein
MTVNHNGVVGMTSLLIVVDSLQKARNEFKKTGFTELESNDSVVRFKITRNQELHIVAPNRPVMTIPNFEKNAGPAYTPFVLKYSILRERAIHF